MHLLSDKLARMIESHTDLITKRWLSEIKTDNSMSSFTVDNTEYMRERVANVMLNLREWISYDTSREDIGRRYAVEGIEYFKKGLPLCEVVRSFTLLKKVIWNFTVNESSIDSAYELYQLTELYERIILFFDQAMYYSSRGYMQEMNCRMKDLWKLSDDDTEKIFFHKSFYNKRPESGKCN